MDLLFLLLLSSISFLFLFLFFHSNPNPSKGLRNYPLVGNLPQFVNNRHRLLDWFTDLLADSPTNTIFLRLFVNLQGVVTSNSANVEYILKTNFDNYPKGARFFSLLHDFLGQGIFNSDGDQWRVQRKTASLEFNTRSLRSFVVDSVQREIVTRLLPVLEKAARGAAVLDLQDVLERFAFDNVCKVAFGEDPACLEEDGGGNLESDFPSAFKEAAHLSAGRFRYAIPGIWKIKKLFDVGSERRLKESIATVHGFAEKIIRSRKEEASPNSVHEDLLSRFIANDNNSDEFLRDIVISFLLAGRETTSSSLAWFFWILSTRPDVEMRILEEIKSVRAKNPAAASKITFEFDELREMHYLHASLSEALRLYPPVPVNSIVCNGDDVLPDGTKVKKGWFMSYCSYAMGRMVAVWGEDCMEYKPERWLEENGTYQPESPFRFPAFHAGPRVCLGKEMAYIQMKSIAACMMERFDVDVIGKEQQPEQMLSLTLRMKDGLPVTLKKRSDIN